MATSIHKLSASLLSHVLSSGTLLTAEDVRRFVEQKNVEQAAAVVEAINAETRVVTLRSLATETSVSMDVADDVATSTRSRSVIG